VQVTCTRCARTADAQPPGLPDDWEGSVNDAVCPGCQYAEWHPRCTSVRAEHGYGERIDVEALKRGEPTTVNVNGLPVLLRSTSELEPLGVGWCDYIDLSVAFLDPSDDWPQEWRCPECGGTTFEGVHADYQASGLKGAGFNGTVEGDED